jgi:PAS domain-containing protein
MVKLEAGELEDGQAHTALPHHSEALPVTGIPAGFPAGVPAGVVLTGEYHQPKDVNLSGGVRLPRSGIKHSVGLNTVFSPVVVDPLNQLKRKSPPPAVPIELPHTAGTEPTAEEAAQLQQLRARRSAFGPKYSMLPPSAVLRVKSQGAREGKLSTEELHSLTPSARRKYERNQREKRRSFTISSQIKTLQEELIASKVQCTNNKHSVLCAANEFIMDLCEELRSQDSSLEVLKNLVRDADDLSVKALSNATSNRSRAPEVPANTATTTTADVNARSFASSLVMRHAVDKVCVPASKMGDEDNTSPVDSSSSLSGSSASASKGSASCKRLQAHASESGMSDPKIDFKSVFTSAPVPLSLLSTEGEILSVNNRFEIVSGYRSDDVVGSNVGSFVAEKDSFVAEKNDVGRSGSKGGGHDAMGMLSLEEVFSCSVKDSNVTDPLSQQLIMKLKKKDSESMLDISITKILREGNEAWDASSDGSPATEGAAGSTRKEGDKKKSKRGRFAMTIVG